jgi:hypothetical protein
MKKRAILLPPKPEMAWFEQHSDLRAHKSTSRSGVQEQWVIMALQVFSWKPVARLTSACFCASCPHSTLCLWKARSDSLIL